VDRATAELPLTTGARLEMIAEPGGWRLQLQSDAASESPSDVTSDLAGDASRWLIEQFAASGESLPGSDFRVHRYAGAPPSPPAGERSTTVDETHRCVVVGEQVVVTWLTRVDDAEHPALRTLPHLAKVGYAGAPVTFGALSWRSPTGRELPCAFVSGFLPDAVGGRQWCVDALETGNRPGFPAELGRFTAGLHVALGSPSTLFPLPMLAMGTGQVRRWHAQARLRLVEVVERIGELDDVPTGSDGARAHRRPSDVVAEHRPRMESLIDQLLDVTGRTPVQLVHGDLHIGQFLSRPGGLAITNFDRSPAVAEAAVRQPAARDIAQLLLSLDQVGRTVDRASGFTRTAEINEWSASARVEFLVAYREALTEVERRDVLDVRLLPSFLVEQACRDLLRCIRFQPSQAYATLDGLDTLLTDLALPEPSPPAPGPHPSPGSDQA
jgi:maltokinase